GTHTTREHHRQSHGQLPRERRATYSCLPHRDLLLSRCAARSTPHGDEDPRPRAQPTTGANLKSGNGSDGRIAEKVDPCAEDRRQSGRAARREKAMISDGSQAARPTAPPDAQRDLEELAPRK